MEGMEFIPSESVWANIEKAVAGAHDHRRGFYFWRFVIPAMLLAGAVSVLYFAGRPVASPSNRSTVAKTAASESPVSPVAPVSPLPSSAVPSRTPSVSPVTPSAVSPVTPSVSPATPSTPATSSASATPSASVQPKKIISGSHVLTTGRSVNSSFHASAGKGHHTNSGTGGIHQNNAAEDKEMNDRDQSSAVNAPTITKAPAITDIPAATASATIAPYLYQPPLAGQGSASVVRAAKPAAKTKTIALGKLQKTKRPWEAGFTAGGGISRLNHLNLSASSNYNDQPLSTNYYNLAATGTNATTPSKQYVSDIRPDASFTAGIYLQKPLTSRWTLNIGMGLHYYSTRITIGQAVNTYVPAAASLISPTALSPTQQSTTAFIAGDQQVFTNHYYFLELPVNMQYQLNKSHLLPVFLQAGLSLSRLMGSDALFYNAHSGVYYKDPGVLEKTQFNASSALMVGLPFHGIKIQLGPEVEYGLSPLINNSRQGDQHFLYTGIRVVVIPGKK